LLVSFLPPTTDPGAHPDVVALFDHLEPLHDGATRLELVALFLEGLTEAVEPDR
jgi:hypothetical protein